MEPRHHALAEYVFDALDEQQREALEEHLRQCALCRRDLVRMGREGLVGALSIEPVEPPPGLRERILEATRHEPQARQTRRVPAFQLPAHTTWVRALAVAASVVFVTAGLYQWRVRQSSTASAEAVARSFAAQGGTRRVPLQGATGSLAYRRTGEALLYLPRLGHAPSGLVYVAWVIDAGHARTAGSFTGGAPVALHLSRPVSRGSSVVGVSLEHSRDAVVPHGGLVFATPVV